MSELYADINNYEFQKTIGEGNFAKVKLSIFKPTKEEFAIKIINKKKLRQKMRNTLFRETEIISKLKHPNIITVIQLIEDEDNYYIVMENCKRGELFDYIVQHQNLSENEASIFFYQLINGVEYIHSQNIVHRDLKPENLLLTENKILKIIDFGLSHPFDGTFFLKTKCGSPSYAAPEIINNTEYDGFKTDVWCCGVILYAMLCGFLPFEGENDTELFKSIIECDPEIPKELSRESKKLIRKIFTTNPNKRITIPEIKKTKFYLKGKELYKAKYSKEEDSPINKNFDFIKEFCNNLLEVENENDNENHIKENNNNNNNIIAIDEDNNNYEAITICSNDEDINDIIINDKKGNNINIFDLSKIKKINAAQTINVHHININNKNNKNDSNEINENNDKENKHLQTFGNAEKNKIPKMKLQLNFNNNLRNNNNHIFNSFRKRLIKDDLNQKLKEKFENYQKVMKTDTNEHKIEAIKMHSINQNNEDKITNNNNNDNNYNNNNDNDNNNNNSNNNKQLNELMHISNMPNIKDNGLPQYKTPKRNLILKLNSSNKIKTILNSNNKSKNIFLGKSPFQIPNLLTKNIDSKNIQTTSFNRFVNNLQVNKLSMKNISNRRKIFDTSNNNKKNSITENNHLNTINTNKIYLSNKTKNSRSIEVKNNKNIINKINNTIIINKKKFASPWKYFAPKIIRKGKLSPSICIKNNLIKNHLINSTPKRSNLYYNNININTINVNENRNNKLLIENKLKEYSDKRKNKNDDNTNYINTTESQINNKSDKNHSIKNNNNNHLKINFSKLIAKTKNKNTIYYHDKNNNNNNNNNTNNNNQTIGKSLGPHHKKKEGGLYILRNDYMQRNFGNNNLSKNRIIRKGNPKSEDRCNQKQKYKNIPLLNNNIYINNIISKK